MRRLPEPEAHRQRMDVIEGRYPEGLQARCAWCGRVGLAAEGRFFEVVRAGLAVSQVFKCSECLESDHGDEGRAA